MTNILHTSLVQLNEFQGSFGQYYIVKSNMKKFVARSGLC